MRPESFDALTRVVGRTASRRRALALLAGGAVAAFGLPQVLRQSTAQAASRASSGRQIAASFECSDTNFPFLESCQDISQYRQTCGTMCPGGERRIPNADGCTVMSFAPDEPDQGPVFTWQDPIFGGWCAQRTVSVFWRVYSNETTLLHPIITTPMCCQDACNSMVDGYIAAIDEHEQGHRLRNDEIIARANVDWDQKPMSWCGASSESEARKFLQIHITEEVDSAYDAMSIDINASEPPVGAIEDCSKCTVASSRCSHCVNGTCQGCTAGKVCCNTVPFLCCAEGWTCCPEPANQGNDGCCNPGRLCCPFEQGGGCCPFNRPHCYISPIVGPACSAFAVGAGAAAAADADSAARRNGKPVLQTNIRNRKAR